MLKAPDDDLTAVNDAARRTVEHFQQVYPPPNPLGDAVACSSRMVTACIADLTTLAFDMIAEVLHPSSEHERLTLFLIKIQNVSDQGFFGVKASHVLTRYGT